MSFTTRIEFSDESGRQYPIFISGTTDNCLFTNYSYLLRCPGEYRVDEEENGTIMIREDDGGDVNSVYSGTKD